MASIAISEFRRDCLKLLDNLPPEGLTITKRGQPVANVTRVRRKLVDFIGCLPDLAVDPNDNLFSTGIKWDAESRHPRIPRRRAK
jgi:antitoxin (DNA-binding transcriptional repressor) of toxin-antitoxin stability system